MNPTATGLSPYVVALGERRQALHPRLRAYFSSIPAGSLGVGEGVFDRVGTRLRWLRPFLRPFERRGVLVADWATQVPFRIENRTVAGRAIGRRILTLPRGEWVMTDAVALNAAGRPVDLLGAPPLVAASFDVEVTDGALTMTSRAVGIRVGAARIRMPRLLSPVVRLTERWDDDRDEQRVEVTIDAPVLGRVYEYAGGFRYRIEEDA